MYITEAFFERLNEIYIIAIDRNAFEMIMVRELAFHGGIDTQSMLPCSTADEVRRETRHFIDVLNQYGGYILMASQGFAGDVPLENIEAMYSVR